MLGYWCGKRFGSKIARANRKEGDRVVTLHNLLCTRTHPLPCHPPSYSLWLFSSQTFSRINTPTFLKPSHSAPTCLWRFNGQSVPKRRHIKFRRRGITQKKVYNIPNRAEVLNQGVILYLQHTMWAWKPKKLTINCCSVSLTTPTITITANATG